MEQVTAQLQVAMDETTRDMSEAGEEWLRATQNIGGLLVMDVGPRGGGKTTKASWLVQFYKQYQPEVRRVSNVPMEDAYYVPDILKFLATKLKVEGVEKAYDVREDGTVRILPRTRVPARMLTIVDESAISGFEARGSGLSALNSYLLALSRKLNVDCELISQMMSMVEKRGQWLSDFYWLCEPSYVPGTKLLDHFRYRVYDEGYRKTNEFHVSREDAKEHLFKNFDTWDIPNFDQLQEAFTIQYNIGDDDIALYESIKNGTKFVPQQQVEPNIIYILEKKWLRTPSARYPGDTFFYYDDNPDPATGAKKRRRYEILQRDYDFERGAYQYRAREIPDNAPLEAMLPQEDAVGEEAEK